MQLSGDFILKLIWNLTDLLVCLERTLRPVRLLFYDLPLLHLRRGESRFFVPKLIIVTRLSFASEDWRDHVSTLHRRVLLPLLLVEGH